jgi:hypothetical protein
MPVGRVLYAHVSLDVERWGNDLEVLQLSLSWPPLKINFYKTFRLALQAWIAHWRQPAL